MKKQETIPPGTSPQAARRMQKSREAEATIRAKEALMRSQMRVMANRTVKTPGIAKAAMQTKMALLKAPENSLSTESRRPSLAGRRSDLGGVFFRSRMEANYARWLNLMIEKHQQGIVKWEFEPQEFEFPVKRGARFYLPDFKVYFSDGHYEWHETKGHMDAKSATKIKRFRKYFPGEILIVIDDRAFNKVRAFRALIPNWEVGEIPT